MDIELARVLRQLPDLRFVLFLADEILRHADDVNRYSDWGIGMVRAIQASGANSATVDSCLERLVGVTASEILREKRERH
jgi:hypothetical protein